MIQLTGHGTVHGIDLDSYAPMVWSIAQKYVRRGPLAQQSPEDLYQIGWLGLLKAARRFDPGRGAKFSTFAYHHVGGAIRHALTACPGRQDHPVRCFTSTFASSKAVDDFEASLPATTPADAHDALQPAALLRGSLSGQLLEVALARWIDGRKQRCLAWSMGISRQRVQQLEEDARTALARRLDRPRPTATASWQPARSIVEVLRDRGVTLGPRHVAGAA